MSKIQHPDRRASFGAGLRALASKLVALQRGDTRYTVTVAAPLVFFVSFAFHLLTTHLQNDHYDQISGAWKILVTGEVPHRDFFDPGYLLSLYSSAAWHSSATTC